MKQSQKINAYMFNLLIEKEMDNFSVTEARDAYLLLFKTQTNLDEARKYVYRQILSFERKGWLVSNGAGHKKKYTKTELFLQTDFISRTTVRKHSLETAFQVGEVECEFTVLQKEKNQYEGELAIILGEVEEYKSLIQRFPQKKEFFLPLFNEAKESSAKLLGRINALSKALKVSGAMVKAC